MKTLRPAFVACMSVLFVGCVPIPISEGSRHDEKVSVSAGGLYYFPWPAMGPEWSHIRVFGRSYSKPRGSGLCYLKIPQKNALLFVTGEHGAAVVHLVDLTTHKERHFPAYDSLIGYEICNPAEYTSHYEKVESVSGDIVVISAAGYNTRSKHVIDFKKPQFIREERDTLGFRSGIWKHSVFEGGKFPNDWRPFD